MSSIETMLSNQIDGFLVSFSKETTDFDHFSRLLNQGYPIVIFDRVPEIPHAISVMVDDYKGALEATDILLDMIEKKLDSDTITGPMVLETELLIRKSSVRL